MYYTQHFQKAIAIYINSFSLPSENYGVSTTFIMRMMVPIHLYAWLYHDALHLKITSSCIDLAPQVSERLCSTLKRHLNPHRIIIISPQSLGQPTIPTKLLWVEAVPCSFYKKIMKPESSRN